MSWGRRAKNAPVLPASHHDATDAFCPQMLICIGPSRNQFMLCQSPHDPPKRPMVPSSTQTPSHPLLCNPPSEVWSCSLHSMFFLPTPMYPSSYNRMTSDMKCIPYVVLYAPLTTLMALCSAVVPLLCCSDRLGRTSKDVEKEARGAEQPSVNHCPISYASQSTHLLPIKIELAICANAEDVAH